MRFRLDNDITDKIHSLCRIAALLCGGDEEKIKDSIRQAMDGGITTTEIREVILTSYLFDGYPTALEGFRLLSEITGVTAVDTRLSIGADDPDKLVQPVYRPDQVELWRCRGERLCRTIYGPQFEQLRHRVAEVAPELYDAMIVEGYGKVLARKGLDTMIRELCVVAILTVKNRPRQLLSHTLGALRLGAEPNHFDIIIDVIIPLVPADQIHGVRCIIDQALRKMNLP
ncbi:MAG: hypothetical protein P9M15_07985 [Candidatus Electryoneaceae bacterium]|nr:hypothetical protein [Candidatus Electryoneaceae bacterium]